MLRKPNIYIKEVGGMLVKMKGTFFYIIEIRGSVWRLLFWNFSSWDIAGNFQRVLENLFIAQV